MNFVQQQFQPNHFTKQNAYNNTNNSASVAATLVQIKSLENSPTSKTVSNVTFNSPENPMTKLGGTSFTNAARAQLWTLALYNNKNSSFLMRDDKDINFVALDLPNQNVLKNDCNRTRVNTFSPSLRANLEKLLTCYCKRENITYKQGLHELAAPFILFLESGISLSETYNLFALFIDKFVPSFYNDQDFLSLQCCQKALSLLLKYHDPALYTFLTSNYLTPEIFSMPWFLTLFASKLELNVVYLLWDLYLVEQDPYFIFFLALGLLIENKHIIMSSSIAVVPEILTNLTIENRDQLKQIYKRAKTLKLNTLQSFVRKLEELEIFKRGYPNDKALKAKIHQNLDYLERLAHIVLSPYELLQALYPVEIECANPNCSNLPNGSKKDNIPSRKDSFQNLELNGFSSRFEHDGSFLCTNCVTRASSSSRFILEKSMGHLSDILKEKGSYQIQDGNQTYHISFVIMDLRASKEAGYLPRSHLIDPSRLKPGAINQLIDEFARLRGVSHFIIMTSKFDSSSFSLKPEDRQQPDQGSASSENNLAAQFLAALTRKGFPYLSIVEGGFSKVNQILNKRNVELLRSTPWTPKSIFKVDSIATTEHFYSGSSPKASASQVDFRGTYNDLPSANSNHSRGYDFSTENATSPTNSLNRPKTPNPSSGIFSSARQEVQEPIVDPQQRSKSTLKNQRKIEQPLSSKIDFHTPKTDPFQSKLGFSNHSEVIIQTRASTEASPEKLRLKPTVSTPAFLMTQGLISSVRTISSPGPTQGGFSSPKITKEAMGYEENPIRASREIFSQQKNKMASTSTRENYHHESSGGSGVDGSRSPLSIDNNNNHQKSCRSAITSPAYNTPSQNSPVHHNNSQREQMKTIMMQQQQGANANGTQAPISDFSSMVRYQSSLTFSTNFAGLGSGKVQINNFERDQDFTKSAYANKEVNSIGDYMNDRKYFANTGDGRLGSDRDSKYSTQQDYKASTFSNRRNDDLTPEQRPSPLLREYKSFERLEEVDSKNNLTQNKRGQKSMTMTPQMPQKANAVTQSNKSISGRVQTASNQTEDNRDNNRNGKIENKHFYGVGSTERAIIMANEMLRRKGEATPGKDKEKVKKRDSEGGFSPTKGHYFNQEYQSQYQAGSESYLGSQQQQRSSSTSRRPMINSGSLSAKTLAVTSPRTILPDDEYHFYNYFQKRSFALYICEHFQKIGEEEKSNGATEDNSPEKSILVISQELVITVQFNQNVLQKLILIQKGVSASQLVQSPTKNGYSQFSKETAGQRDLGILSVLPLKLLLKVTSKKVDPKFISIYFKFPKQEEECFRRYYEVFDQSNMTLEEIFRTAENREFEHILDEVRTHKDDKKFTEIKSVYRLENEETAQKCIVKVKEAYKKNPGGF